MNAGADVVALLRSHEGTSWTPRPPASASEVVATEKALGKTFPPEYKSLLMYSDGGTLRGAEARVFFFRIEEVRQFNGDPVWSSHIPGMVIFGDDLGDYIYYFDPENRLHRGAWAVYLVEKGAVSFDYSKYAAGSVEHLCRRVIHGDPLVSEPYLA